jgi:hypothetical protein
MANGAALNPMTLVGQVRLVIGDDVPVSPSDLTYTFSDDAITVALSLANDGVTRAVGILVKQLALQASLSGQSIKADDFSINTSGRGKTLLEVAQSYFDQADAEDVTSGAGELAIVNTRLKGHTEPSSLLWNPLDRDGFGI